MNVKKLKGASWWWKLQEAVDGICLACIEVWGEYVQKGEKKRDTGASVLQIYVWK